MLQFTKWLFERFWYGDSVNVVWDAPSEPVAPPPPRKSSLIGETAGALVRARQMQIECEQRLTDEIAALVEERRQRRKQIEAMTAALVAIGDDPAFTDTEQTEAALHRDVYIHTPDIGL